MAARPSSCLQRSSAAPFASELPSVYPSILHGGEVEHACTIGQPGASAELVRTISAESATGNSRGPMAAADAVADARPVGLKPDRRRVLNQVNPVTCREFPASALRRHFRPAVPFLLFTVAVVLTYVIGAVLPSLPSMRGDAPCLATMTVWIREHRVRPHGPSTLSNLCLTRATNAN